MTRIIVVVVLVILSIIITPSNGKESSKPVVLTESTWGDMLEGEWMVEFYAPWCPACRQLSEIWDKFSSWSKDLDIKVAQVDVTENAGLSGRFLIFALPTIYHVKDGVFRVYRGPREENDFISFVDEKKWEEIEPVIWWQNPGSFHMGAVGWFFKISMLVRQTFTLLTEEYQLPVWSAYVIFAIATVVIGLLLGLTLVCLCDFICPPRYSKRDIHVEKDKESDVEEEQEESDMVEGDAGSTSAAVRKRKVRKD